MPFLALPTMWGLGIELRVSALDFQAWQQRPLPAEPSQCYLIIYLGVCVLESACVCLCGNQKTISVSYSLHPPPPHLHHQRQGLPLNLKFIGSAISADYEPLGSIHLHFPVLGLQAYTH